MEKEFYKSFITKIKTKEDKKYLDDQEITNLYKIPKKDKGDAMPHITSFEPNQIHQCDILYLPDDDGYKYALVVVDDCTGLIDAEPMKGRTAQNALDGIKKIYERGILHLPSYSLEVDDGSEFKGAFKKYITQKKIFLRVAQSGRHRQQGLVENRNHILGRAIGMYQTSIEIISEEPCTEWVNVLPEIVRVYNDTVKLRPKKKISNEPLDQHGQELLEVGQKVRIQLDNPRNATPDEKRLHGRFRATDVRWTIAPSKISEILLQPNRPVMYLVDGKKSVAYTRNQLQPISETEKAPDTKIMKVPKSVKTFKVEKLLDKRTVGRKVQYLTKFYAFETPEWIDGANIPVQFIEEYKEKSK